MIRATVYRPPDADTLWDILDASQGTLVASPMTIGGSGWFRVVDGELEGMYINWELYNGERISTYAESDKTVDDFANMFDDDNPITIMSVEDSPFQ